MHRPRNLWCLLPLLAVLAFSVAGCGGSEHDQMIRRFFQASAMGDNITIGNISTVGFDPTKDGKASNVSFVSETPEQTKELKINELTKVFQEAQAADTDFSKKKNEYQDKNLESINRVIKIEQSGKGKPGGKDAEVQASWTKWRDDQAVVQKKVSEARKALQAERKVADLSLTLPDKDIATLDSVTQATKEVTVSASVVKDGQTTKKNLVLTLQRVVAKDKDKTIEGKWMITDIKEAGAGKAS